METRKAKKANAGALAWYIRSKGFASVADIRRSFALVCEESVPIQGPLGTVFVGLPEAPARALERLWSDGKIGVELSIEFDARIVTGLYAVNPPGGAAQPPASSGQARAGRPAPRPEARPRPEQQRKGQQSPQPRSVQPPAATRA